MDENIVDNCNYYELILNGNLPQEELSTVLKMVAVTSYVNYIRSEFKDGNYRKEFIHYSLNLRSTFRHLLDCNSEEDQNVDIENKFRESVSELENLIMKYQLQEKLEDEEEYQKYIEENKKEEMIEKKIIEREKEKPKRKTRKVKT